MEIGVGIRSEELFIIGNVSVSFCDIVDAQIQDHRGIWRLGKGGGQFAGTFIFQPFVAFAFLCDEAAGVGGLMGFHRGRHTGGPGIAHKDEAVACGAFRLRDIDVRLLDRDDIAAEAVFQDADGLAAHVEGEVNGSGKEHQDRQDCQQDTEVGKAGFFSLFHRIRSAVS